MDGVFIGALGVGCHVSGQVGELVRMKRVQKASGWLESGRGGEEIFGICRTGCFGNGIPPRLYASV